MYVCMHVCMCVCVCRQFASFCCTSNLTARRVPDQHPAFGPCVPWWLWPDVNVVFLVMLGESVPDVDPINGSGCCFSKVLKGRRVLQFIFYGNLDKLLHWNRESLEMFGCSCVIVGIQPGNWFVGSVSWIFSWSWPVASSSSLPVVLFLPPCPSWPGNGSKSLWFSKRQFGYRS